MAISKEQRAAMVRGMQARARELPLNIVAKAINSKPATLRSRLSYFEYKVRGKSLAELADAVRQKFGDKLTPTQRGKLSALVAANLAAERLSEPAPELRDNPHDDETETVNLMAIQACARRLAKLVLPIESPDEADELVVTVLELHTLAIGSRRRKRRT